MPTDATQQRSEQVAVRFPAEDLAWVRAYAEATERTLAQVLRLAVRKFREAEETPND